MKKKSDDYQCVKLHSTYLWRLIFV